MSDAPKPQWGLRLQQAWIYQESLRTAWLSCPDPAIRRDLESHAETARQLYLRLLDGTKG